MMRRFTIMALVSLYWRSKQAMVSMNLLTGECCKTDFGCTTGYAERKLEQTLKGFEFICFTSCMGHA